MTELRCERLPALQIMKANPDVIETNPMLNDITWMEGGPPGNRVTVRTGLPEVRWRKPDQASRNDDERVTDAGV